MAREPKNGVWVGLRSCGCCVAVVVDDGDYQDDMRRMKRKWLDDGLSVVHATWAEWLEKHRPSMGSNCPHRLAL